MEKFRLHNACMCGDLTDVKKYLEDDANLVTLKDADGRYPIHWAISYQNETIVNALLTRMETINLTNLVDESGWNPIHIGASVGNISIFKQLLNYNISSLDAQTNAGTTALHLACSKKHIDIVKLLLDAGASPRVKDKNGQLPLHRVCAIGSIPILKLLCDSHKSPVNANDCNNWTPLHHALSEGHGEIAVMLVQEYHADWEFIKNNSDSKAIAFEVDSEVMNFFMNSVS